MSVAARHRSRRFAASACLAALPLLAGCMSLDSSTTIVSDQEIHTLVDVGISNEVANTYGLDARTICGPFTGALPGGAVASPYTGNDGVHCRITATSTLAQMQAAPGSAMSITHSGHEYRFSFSPSEAALGGVSLPGSTTGVDAVRVQVTFPGRVLSTSSDAHVQNHTVTWDQRGDITHTLSASGLDQASHGQGLLRWLPAASALLLALVAAAVLLHDRRRHAAVPPTAPQSFVDTAPPAPGFVDADATDAGPHAPSTGAHAWTPASGDRARIMPATAPEARVPHETTPQDMGLEETARPALPATPTQTSAPPTPPADPWGGRSPWQRPE